MMSAVPGSRSILTRHSQNSNRALGQKSSAPLRAPVLIGAHVGRRHHLGSFTCRTREQGSTSSSALHAARGDSINGKNSGTSETFQQLRQAVLSSLDFSDNSEQTQDWEDVALESIDDIPVDPQGSAAAVGKAVYETLRIDKAGKTRRVYVRRRDLIRSHGLQPRDLRRVDPSLSPTKTSPSVSIKEECVLINIGGVRAVITADRCMLFEPSSSSSRKFVELVMPRLQGSAAQRARQDLAAAGGTSSVDPSRQGLISGTGSKTGDGYTSTSDSYETAEIFPFELEILEAALMVATGKLEADLVAATRRVGAVLQKLPREITPVNLEELRRVKQLLVELESKAENLRDLLEELMDDEDEVRELNLSSRPKREEKRRQRERERLEREMEREWAERGMRLGEGASVADPSLAAAAGLSAAAAGAASPSSPVPTLPTKAVQSATPQPQQVQKQTVASSSDNGGADDGFVEAQDALEEMMEEEEEEREVEEVEDLLEYYLQRSSTTQSEAERLLAGARDLEESIGVSLSARRFEVNRLELLLSIASFSAALGAMVASIFGMNLRSTLEMSVVGFWGTTALIILGCVWIFWVLYKYTKGKRIL